MAIELKKSNIKLKRTDLANMFSAHLDDAGNTIFYMGRTLSFGNINKLNEKYIVRYNWKDGDSWYKLSTIFFNDYKLWWIICRLNGATNPFNLPKCGDIIAIPSSNLVEIILNKIAAE